MWVEGKFLLKKGAYQDTIDLLSPKIFDWITNIHADSGMSVGVAGIFRVCQFLSIVVIPPGRRNLSGWETLYTILLLRT